VLHPATILASALAKRGKREVVAATTTGVFFRPAAAATNAGGHEKAKRRCTLQTYAPHAWPPRRPVPVIQTPGTSFGSGWGYTTNASVAVGSSFQHVPRPSPGQLGLNPHGLRRMSFPSFTQTPPRPSVSNCCTMRPRHNLIASS